MQPGAWSLFLHPRRWAREIAVMAADAEASGQEIENLETCGRELRHEVARLESSNMTLTSKIVSLENCVNGLTADLLKTRRELDDRKDTETQIREFNAKITAVEARKREYDERIARMREEIAFLKERLRQREVVFPESSSEEHTDWFEPLPEDL